MAESRKGTTSAKHWGCLVFGALAFALIIALLIAHSPQRKEAKERQREIERLHAAHADRGRQIREVLVSLAQQYNVILDWEEQLKSAYTVELQEMLIRDDRRPVIFTSSLQDILTQDGRHFLVFGPDQQFPFDVLQQFNTVRHIYYVLECSAEQVATIRNDVRYHLAPRGTFGERPTIAVVATMASLGKPLFEVQTIKSFQAGDDTRLIIRATGATFVVRGQCVAVLPLP